MHGPGYAPPPQPQRPSTALLVVLRVIFVAISLLSIGFLAWAAMLRLAIVTRKRLDWGLFWGSVGLLALVFGLFVGDHTDDFSTWHGTTGMILLLLSSVAWAGYFLYADIRHYQQPRFLGYVPTQPPAYGYPAPQPPAHHTPVPPAHHTPVTPAHHTPIPPTAPIPGPPVSPAAAGPTVPMAPQPPNRPAPARIDQVRAELDELSDYLRQQDAGHDHGHGPGYGSGDGQEHGR